MTLEDLIKEADSLKRHAERMHWDPKEIPIVLITSDQSLGPRASVPVRGISPGFDWETNRINITTEQPVIKRKQAATNNTNNYNHSMKPTMKRPMRYDDLITGFDTGRRFCDLGTAEQNIAEDRLSRDTRAAIRRGSKIASAITSDGNVEDLKPADRLDALRLPFYLRMMSVLCNELSSRAGWWKDADGKPLDVAEVTPAKMLLIHTEISEAVEGFRKGLQDDHLPSRTMLETELADAVIRILDLAEAHECDLGHAIMEKLIYNARRADHKPENRAKEGGKKF